MTTISDNYDIHSENTLGLQERSLLMWATGPQPRLEYPTKLLRMKNGCNVECYLIPEADKKKVLDTLYPFTDPPSLDAIRVDLHTEKLFTVKDFMVVREGEGNFLVTPYYAEAGGTVLDWVDPSAEKNMTLCVS